jgi:hypothetical protein
MWRGARDRKGVDVVFTSVMGEVTTMVRLRIERGRGIENVGEKWEGIEFGQMGNGEAEDDEKVEAWDAYGMGREDEVDSEDIEERDFDPEVDAVASEATPEHKDITMHADEDAPMQLQQPHLEVSLHDFSRTRMWLHNSLRTWRDREREEYSAEVIGRYPGIAPASGSIYTRDNLFAGSSIDGDLMTTKWVRRD